MGRVFRSNSSFKLTACPEQSLLHLPCFYFPEFPLPSGILRYGAVHHHQCPLVPHSSFLALKKLKGSITLNLHWLALNPKKGRELGSFHCSLKTSCANSSGACKCSVMWLKVMQKPLPLLLCQKGINKQEENICQGWFYPSGPVFRGGFWYKEYLCKLRNSEGISKALLAARFAGKSHLKIKAADRPWLHMLLYQSQLPALGTPSSCTAFKVLHQWSDSRACCEHSIIETHQESYSHMRQWRNSNQLFTMLLQLFVSGA